MSSFALFPFLFLITFRVNNDGAGPYACDISADTTGADFRPMTVIHNLPGVLGISEATTEDFPLLARMFSSYHFNFQYPTLLQGLLMV